MRAIKQHNGEKKQSCLFYKIRTGLFLFRQGAFSRLNGTSEAGLLGVSSDRLLECDKGLC